MTERRRYFPGVPAQQVPGRTVDLAMRLQRVADAPAPATGAPGPATPVAPRWVGWSDEGSPATSQQTGRAYGLDPYVAWGNPSNMPFVAWVDGAVSVDWSVSFVPTFWKTGVGVIWEGDALESMHPPEGGYLGFPAVRDVALPDLTSDGGPSPGYFFQHEADPSKYGLAFEPVLLAAGNTITLAPQPETCPGVLTATASVAGVEVGEVTFIFSAFIPATP